MTIDQAFFESSCMIDAGTGTPANHLVLNELPACKTKREAKLLLEELRERLRSVEGGRFKMNEDSKQRLIAALSTF